MSQKSHLLEFLSREIPVTVKTMKALPSDQLMFKPHERSGTARDLLRNFIIEAKMATQLLDGKTDWSTVMPPEMPTAEEYITAYQESLNEFQTKIESITDEALTKKDIVPWGTEPMSRLDGVWYMFYDMIHHRGQLTVYIRLSGGLVPAIYGPSADDNGND